jgi:hypothetical protein
VEHCLRGSINNDSLFFGLIKQYAESRKHKVVSTSDIVSFVNSHTGMNFTPFFNKFLYNTSLPVLEYSFTHENGEIRLKYRWTEVDEGFFMPFSLITGKGQAIRFEGTTDFNEITLNDAEWFSFVNVWGGYANSPVNGLTYYYTKWIND